MTRIAAAVWQQVPVPYTVTYIILTQVSLIYTHITHFLTTIVQFGRISALAPTLITP